MDKRQALPEGYQLHGGRQTYKIEKFISSGANSMVYQASYQDTLMSQHIHTVLIKELYPYTPDGGITRDEQMQLHVKADAEKLFEFHKNSYLSGNQVHLILGMDADRNIAQNLDSFEQNQTLYTVFSARKGQTLGDVLKQKKGFPSLTDAVLCIQNILYALRIFHSHGFLHMDLSPENIFLLDTQDESFPSEILLLDFNSVCCIEKGSDKEELFRLSYYPGKEGYMAPEILLQKTDELGPWTDLYSVCCIFYCILMDGERPQDMELKREPEIISPYSRLLLHEKEVAAMQVNRILSKGMHVLPDQRYQNTEELLKDTQELLEILNGTRRIAVEVVPEGQNSRIPAAAGQKRKRKILLASLAGAVVLAGTAAAVFLNQPPKEDTVLDLTQYPLETDDSVILTQQNVRYPLKDNIMEVQVQGDTAVRILLKDFTYERDTTDALDTYSFFSFYNGKGDKRGWQNAGLTYDFFYTEDNRLHTELPFQDTEEFPLEYVGVIMQNFNYSESNVLLEVTGCTLVDGAGNSYEMTELLGSHLLFFDENYWQQNLITQQNQEYVENFSDILGGKLVVDAQVCDLDPVLEVSWSSDHPEIASVDDRGRVHGLRQGTATLTARIRSRQTGEERSTQMLVHVISKLPG